jgi:hypothetical protein
MEINQRIEPTDEPIAPALANVRWAIDWIDWLLEGLSPEEAEQKFETDPDIQRLARLVVEANELTEKEIELRAELYWIHTKLLQPFVDAMLGASGLTLMQAKTAVYYGILTYLYEEFPDLVPILNILGPTGTGKSEAIKQMERFINVPIRVPGSTYTDLGLGLHEAKVAIVEEGDKFSNIKCEYLLQQRCNESQRRQVIHVPPDQKPQEIDNFGCTIIHRRVSFSDTATRNRSITIKTKRKKGDYHASNTDRDRFAEIATQLNLENTPLKGMFTPQGSDRITDAWYPLIVIADACCDTHYLDYVKEVIAKSLAVFMDGEEPDDIAFKAVLAAYHKIAVNSTPDYDKNMKLVDITLACKDRLMINKSSQWLKRVLTDMGFEFSFGAGYDWLKANPELLHELCDEKGYEM